jgi:ribonuclease HI
MTYKKEAILLTKAEAFAEYLRTMGFSAHVKADGFRDYLAKILIDTRGSINLHTNEKETAYTVRTHELKDRALAGQIEACWQAFQQSPVEPTTGYQAYVDGSYRDGVASFAAIILKDGKETERLSGQVTEDIETQQVAGEITAVLRVLEWCSRHGVPEMEVFYDYEGLVHWATGGWRQRSQLTERYARSVSESPTTIRWQKVKSHSGNTWNEEADKAARQALAPTEPSSTEDLLDIADEQARDFVGFLTAHGIPVAYVGKKNNQFIRIKLAAGYFDLYHTSKKPLNPYLHGFNDSAFEEQISTLWYTFRQGAVPEAAAPDSRPDYSEVEYYLKQLERYRHCAFDFSLLVHAISRTFPQNEFDLSQYRYDFDTLEHFYIELKGT